MSMHANLTKRSSSKHQWLPIRMSGCGTRQVGKYLCLLFIAYLCLRMGYNKTWGERMGSPAKQGLDCTHAALRTVRSNLEANHSDEEECVEHDHVSSASCVGARIARSKAWSEMEHGHENVAHVNKIEPEHQAH